MTVNFKISVTSLRVIRECLLTISEIRATLTKKYLDIVVNVEVEVK